ncbi:MAG: CBS domain-containing protein [Deltaproteobacteria bacterium]|nr:CBS domain-containing protein [Deltaproteobacteria bacterium]
MFARDYMTKAIATVHPDDLVIDVAKTMQHEGIRHVPVVENGRLVGIVSRNTLRDASPSKATDLSKREINFLLSKMKVREVMKKEVITCGPDAHVEDVARTMQTKRIGAMPVVEKGKLLGILTNNDMFRILMKILGMDGPGVRITLEIGRGRGELLVDIVKAAKDEGKTIKSLVSIESPLPGRQTVILHLDASDMTEVLGTLKSRGFEIISVDEVK